MWILVATEGYTPGHGGFGKGCGSGAGVRLWLLDARRRLSDGESVGSSAPGQVWTALVSLPKLCCRSEK